MTLIKSVSGIRGTIGGTISEALTPIDIVSFTAAYATMLHRFYPTNDRLKVVVGRDARISGEMVEQLVCGTLVASGIDVVDIGMASTPTTEMAVTFEGADGGVIITASHNPAQWNALKLLNHRGEFLSAQESKDLLTIVDNQDFDFKEAYQLGTISKKEYSEKHIEAVLKYPLVDVEAIRDAHFRVILDPINSVGAVVMPALLHELGVECIMINGTPDGNFAHNPEPLTKNLEELCDNVVRHGADIGISVDPDVDRLALFCEDGSAFGEENTQVAVADYILSHKQGAVATNISSSRALIDVAEAHGCKAYLSKVGEANVVAMLKEVNAVAGGEGNGGVIVPDFHYGRDALIGTALILSYLAQKKQRLSELKASLPNYYVAKHKIELDRQEDALKLFDAVQAKYADCTINRIDGIRIDFEDERKWVILRASNTEPIIRIYAEAPGEVAAEALAEDLKALAKEVL